MLKVAGLVLVCSTLSACAPERTANAGGSSEAQGGAKQRASAGARVSAAEPLVIGETFTINSAIMGEERRINVLVPSMYGEKIDARMPVLYMPDGGLNEDFLHIAGLVQISVSSGTMRPFVLVGIQNTQRRRDMTGPTSNAEDKKIAPVVGGSATFRRFIREELMPTVRAHYRTTEETAIIGESLAGLFAVETFLLEPDLFDSYIAIDPSLWWNDEGLLKSADDRLQAMSRDRKRIFLSCSNEPALAKNAADLAKILDSHRAEVRITYYMPLSAESHATIYHPAALLALRTIFAPPPAATH